LLRDDEIVDPHSVCTTGHDDRLLGKITFRLKSSLRIFNLQAEILKFDLSALIVFVFVCLNACLPTVGLVTDGKCLFGWPSRCMPRGYLA